MIVSMVLCTITGNGGLQRFCIISSALTQEAKISDVVRTRLPYSVISAMISAALFVIMGLRMGSADAAHFVLEGASFRPLILMVLPLTMVVMMKMGWDLTGTLIVCNVAGVVLNVLTGNDFRSSHVHRGRTRFCRRERHDGSGAVCTAFVSGAGDPDVQRRL